MSSDNFHINDLIIRPVQDDDVADIVRLGKLAGPGMTIPRDMRIALSKISQCTSSFNGHYDDPDKAEERKFWLVAENKALGKVVGMAGIYSDVGTFPSFMLDSETLKLRHFLDGHTEIGTLFVDPDHRDYKTDDPEKILKLGRAMSLSRFMLMNARPSWFGENVFAEIRGYQTPDENNLFYERVWKNSLQKTFAEADARVVESGPGFLLKTDVVDANIPVDAWEEDSRLSIGRAHDESAKAAKILEGEGFAKYKSSCDIIGGGPHYACAKREIASFRNTRPLPELATYMPGSKTVLAIANNNPGNFRIAFTEKTGFADVQGAVNRTGYDYNESPPLFLAIG